MKNQKGFRISISASDAVYLAAREVNLNEHEYWCVNIINSDGYYQIILQTIAVRYEMFVDETSGVVCGLNTEPSIDLYFNEDAEITPVA